MFSIFQDNGNVWVFSDYSLNSFFQEVLGTKYRLTSQVLWYKQEYFRAAL